MLTLDLELDSSLELPITWTICSLLFSIWRQRTEGRVILAKTRAELEAKCRILREGTVSSLLNSYTQTNYLLRRLLSGLDLVQIGVGQDQTFSTNTRQEVTEIPFMTKRQYVFISCFYTLLS